jgi:hypothetical protein
MLKKSLLTVALLSSICYGYAQTESTRINTIDHYLGIQANQLFRQIINLSNNNSNLVTNPYLITYSLMLAKSGWGIQTGLGYTYEVIGDENSPANHQSRINDLSYRVGLGRKIMLSKRFEAEFSFDLAGEYKNDKTFTLSVTDFGSGFSDSVSTMISSKTNGIGGGLRGGLNFYLSNRIILGTEANYYFMHAPLKQNINITETFTQSGFPQSTTTTNENQSIDNSKFALTLPAVLFIMVKF